MSKMDEFRTKFSLKKKLLLLIIPIIVIIMLIAGCFGYMSLTDIMRTVYTSRFATSFGSSKTATTLMRSTWYGSI